MKLDHSPNASHSLMSLASYSCYKKGVEEGRLQVPDEKQNRINLESRNVYVNLLGVFLGLDLDLRRALFTVTVYTATVHDYCSRG